MNDWLEAEQRARRADQLYRQGQWREALRELRRAVRVSPDRADWHVTMGLILESVGRAAAAGRAFERAVRLEPDDTQALVCFGRSLLANGHPQRALNVLKRAAAIDRDHEPAYCPQIGAHAALQEHDEAELTFFLARQLREQCPDCLHHLATSLMAREDWSRAIWCWRQTLRLNPHHSQARLGLARAHRAMGDGAAAARAYEQHLALAPADVDAMGEFGRVLTELGHDGLATRKLRHVLDIDPNHVPALTDLGLLSAKHGHVDSAERHLRRAMKLDRRRAGVRLGLARVAQRRGQIAQARHHLLLELDAPPDQRTADQRLLLARLLIELDLATFALRVLDDVEHQSPFAYDRRRLALALHYRGTANLRAERRRAGIADCKRSFMLNPQNPLLVRNLIATYLQSGDLARSRVWLGRLTDLRQHRASADLRRQWRLRWLRRMVARAANGVRQCAGVTTRRRES